MPCGLEIKKLLLPKIILKNYMKIYRVKLYIFYDFLLDLFALGS